MGRGESGAEAARVCAYSPTSVFDAVVAVEGAVEDENAVEGVVGDEGAVEGDVGIRLDTNAI